MSDFVSQTWILKNIFGFADEAIERELKAKAGEGGEAAEALSRDLRKEAPMVERQTRKDLARMEKKVEELLRNDVQLQARLKDATGLVRELRSWGNLSQNGGQKNGTHGPRLFHKQGAS